VLLPPNRLRSRMLACLRYIATSAPTGWSQYVSRRVDRVHIDEQGAGECEVFRASRSLFKLSPSIFQACVRRFTEGRSQKGTASF